MKIVIYSVLYLFGLGDNPISVQPRNDCQAIRSDWENIGKDFYKAIQRYEGQQSIKC